MIVLKKKHARTSLERRRFLKAAGGIAVALPVMESLVGFKAAEAASTADRLAVVMHRAGTFPSLWKPPAVGPLTLSPLLQPLANVKEKLLVVSGLNNKARDLNALVDGHAASNNSLFTCMPFAQNLNANGSLKPASQQTDFGSAAGPSFDQVIANHIGTSTPRRAVYFWADTATDEQTEPGDPVWGSHFWAGSNDPVSGFFNPAQAINLLFTNLPDGTPLTALQRLQMQRSSVLDVVADQLASIKLELGMEDRLRLQAHEQKIRDLEAALDNVANPGDGCAVPIFNPPPGYQPGFNNWAHVSFDIMSQIITMAFECDITRVAAIEFANDLSPLFPFIPNHQLPTPGNSGWHQMIHDVPIPTTANPAALSSDQVAMYSVFEWFSQQVAMFLERMDAVSTNNGTLLDSSMVLWGTEFSTGADHDVYNLPMVLAGGLNGKISTDRHVNFPGYGVHSMNDFLTTIMNLYGVDQNNFGWPAFSNGPLSGIGV